MNLVDGFLEHAEARPAGAALITPAGRAVSYAELARVSAARARGFARAGIGRSDRVLIARGLSAELYATLLAVFRLGAVAVFPEPGAGLAGVRHAVAAAQPKAMAAGSLARTLRPFVPELRALPVLPEAATGPYGDGPLQSTDAGSPALITFTSGSTGRPKGVVRSVGFLQLQHRLLEQVRRTTPEDVDLISLPVFILSNLTAGAASVIPAGDLRRPGSLDGARLRRQAARHRVNRIVAPPSVCARLTEDAEALPGVQAVFTGGGPVFPNLLQALQAAAPGARIHSVYGSTEAEPISHVAFDEIGAADWRAMAEGQGLLAGPPIPEARVAIRGDEIEVAGPHVNRGYLDPSDDASTKVLRDGEVWHRTGDAGRIDEQGRLWLLGRTEAANGDLYPFAVETAAHSWPGVEQAALLAGAGGARLFLAGRGLDSTELERRAGALGDITVHVVRRIPMDRRHNAKVDYARLREQAERLR